MADAKRHAQKVGKSKPAAKPPLAVANSVLMGKSGTASKSVRAATATIKKQKAKSPRKPKTGDGAADAEDVG